MTKTSLFWRLNLLMIDPDIVLKNLRKHFQDMESRKIMDQLITDTPLLIKWAQEEQNTHMRSLVISTIKLSFEAQVLQLERQDGMLYFDLVSTGSAVKKMADIYRRESIEETAG